MSLRVHLAPTGLFSPAMTRIAEALTLHKPADVEIVTDRAKADICLLYVINRDAIPFCEDLRRRGRRYAILQCCLDTSGATKDEWAETWERSSLLWSYYDLRGRAPNVLYSSLGVSSPFIDYPIESCIGLRRRQVITSGHVSGRGAEEIELVWQAARKMKIGITHLSASRVIGTNDRPLDCTGVNFTGHIPDDQLAHLYSSSTWVAGLRYVEGFELPIAEGACCGTRGIVFAQPSTWAWHGREAIYPPYALDEGSSDVEKFNELCSVFERTYPPVADDRLSIEVARRNYDWAPIAREFWARLLGQDMIHCLGCGHKFFGDPPCPQCGAAYEIKPLARPIEGEDI